MLSAMHCPVAGGPALRCRGSNTLPTPARAVAAAPARGCRQHQSNLAAAARKPKKASSEPEGAKEGPGEAVEAQAAAAEEVEVEAAVAEEEEQQQQPEVEEEPAPPVAAEAAAKEEQRPEEQQQQPALAQDPPPEQPTPPAEQPVSSSSSTPSEFEASVEDYKAALLDSFYGTQRGLTARGEIRAEINELISQLEAKNPMPNLTEDMDKLDGTWNLAYTSNSELIAVLALGQLPLVSVGDVTQQIDVSAGTVENKVELMNPLSRTSLTARSAYEVCSPKRLHLKLVGGRVQTPELLTDLELPDTVAILGQSIDLTQLKQSLSPMKSSLDGLVSQVNSFASSQPDLDIPVRKGRAQTWQLNTFLDDDLRIARGDGGSVFIYTRAPAS